MATLPERLSVVETKVEAIERTVDEIRGDVKALLRVVNEERGARLNRAHQLKVLGVVLTVATVVINLAFRVWS